MSERERRGGRGGASVDRTELPAGANGERMTRTKVRWFASAGLVLAALALGRAAAADLRPSGSTPQEAPAAAYPASWRSYVAPDGSFRVVAPGPGTEASQVTPSGVVHRVSFPASGQTQWFVAWLDVAQGVAAGRSDADLVDLAAAPLAERIGASIQEEDILREGPFPGVDLRLSTDRGASYLVRVFAARGRLIEAVAGWTSAAGAADAGRFVRSLQVVTS